MWGQLQDLWESVNEKLFPPEFVIDEKPEAVFESKTAESRATQSSPGQPKAAGEEAGLLRQMTDLLCEQERLQQLATHLERKGGGNDDEFYRFVKQALPFLDNFERLLELARENPPSEELTNWLKSVETLYYRITRVLEQFGLRFINSVGKEVDFEFQDVVEYRPTREFAHNTVIKEIQKGVVFRGRLIRDARVVVACNE